MQTANSDATGTSRNVLNTQAGSHHDARQDPDAGRSQSTQQPAPTVSVDIDRQTLVQPALFFPLQQKPTSEIISGPPPGQLVASQPVLRALEAAESEHGSSNSQAPATGGLALNELGKTSCEQASMITSAPSLDQGSELDRTQAALDKEYRSELSAWVESADLFGWAERLEEVEKRINAYLEKPAEQRRSINLAGLGLSVLPPLPADLIELRANENGLTALPERLPQGLQYLNIEYSNLIALPERLPQGLQELSCSYAGLTALPENLPRGLKSLNVGYNRLTALPENLPQGLQRLYVRGTMLSALPERLPEGLQRLYFDHNQLSALPEHLPQGLQHLDVRYNHLTALPEHLPKALQELRVNNNKLTALPEHLPQGLHTLDVGSNNLIVLPAYLPQNLRYVYAERNRFDAKSLLALMRTNTSITHLFLNERDIDPRAKQEIESELLNNREHPARLLKAAVTLDLLARFGLATSDQTGTLIKRDPTSNPVADQLSSQPIPTELHDVLAANCPKDVLAVLAGMVDGTVQ